MDLVQVVVLGIHPEDRDGWDAVACLDESGQPDGGDRLEQRIERSAKESGLLPGHNRHRLRVRQACRCPRGLYRGVSGSLLRGDDSRDGVWSGRRLASRDGRAPGVIVLRVASEKRGEGAEVRGVVRGQALDAGKAADVDGNGVGERRGGRIRRHGAALLQSGAEVSRQQVAVDARRGGR